MTDETLSIADAVLACAGELYDLDPLHKRKSPRYVECRTAITHILRDMDHSFPEIARLLRMDHTSIYYLQGRPRPALAAVVATRALDRLGVFEAAAREVMLAAIFDPDDREAARGTWLKACRLQLHLVDPTYDGETFEGGPAWLSQVVGVQS